jgi:3-phosphoshikimate 1-carboxyvinyltransferase
VQYVNTGTLLPVFDNDPNDINIVYNALNTIDLQKQNRVGEEVMIDVEDCGAAYRFLMAQLAATPGKWLLTGTPRLLQSPILPLVNFLNIHGAKIATKDSGWHIEGAELQIDDVEIDTTETSQFASAIMMLKAESRKQKTESRNLTSHISNLTSQNPYIRMTERILQMSDDGIRWVSMLSDWSAAVFWIANALLIPNAHYFLKNLHFDSLQGDKEIVPFFIKWGVHFSENRFGIEVRHIHQLDISKQTIDVANMPDTAMILATLAVCYPFELTLSGLKNLNQKESKRLDIMVDELSKFTKIDQHSEDSITIYKRTNELPKVFHFDSYNDHRFVMAWSLFKNFGTVNIENSDCIKKSYPEFMVSMK